ncbi:MAG TPA: hypothetical protein VGQ13_03475 [Nitrososphaera sp.]|nr:hypothetical protein [Nitrososphaera sp.]
MTEILAEKSKDTRSNREGVTVRPPEPIYDLTTFDKAELLKAAGPRERGEE